MFTWDIQAFFFFSSDPLPCSLFRALEASRQAGCEPDDKLQRDREAVGASLKVGPSLSNNLHAGKTDGASLAWLLRFKRVQPKSSRKWCSQKDDTANLQQLFLSSNGGWLKYNYERPGQTTTPPFGLSRTNLLVNVAARLFSGLICSSHCFDVLGL